MKEVKRKACFRVSIFIKSIGGEDGSRTRVLKCLTLISIHAFLIVRFNFRKVQLNFNKTVFYALVLT